MSLRRDRSSLLASSTIYRTPARRCTFESLEQRLVFSVSSLDAPGNNDDPAAVVVADHDPAEAVDFAKFQSREELRNWLIQTADEQFGQLFGTRTTRWSYPHYFYDDVVIDSLVLRAPPLNIVAASANTDAMAFSATNVQVEGVDEADLVETDGRYIYLLSGNDLIIVEAGESGALEIAARLHLDSAPTGMYLHGDRLALLSSNSPTGAPAVSRSSTLLIDDWGGFDGRSATTTVTLLDVVDRSAPKLVEQLQLDGVVRDSRVVNGQLRLVVDNSLQLPTPIARRVEGESAGESEANVATPQSLGGFRVATSSLLAINVYYPPDYGAQDDYQYETREEYIDRVIDEIIDGLPNVRRIALDGEVVSETPLVKPEDIYLPDSPEQGSLTTIATIDMHGNATGVVSKATLISRGRPEVYGTEEGVFLFQHGWRSQNAWDDDWSGGGYRTSIYKFSVDEADGEVKLVARGSVEGTLLNQFSVDEHDGYLRVVTRESHWEGAHQLFVLKQSGHKFKVVGQVGGMAPGEELHSVRFMGDRAFVVTFRKVDPLFALDLSDPANPTVAGELKIPGFSDYLQPIDANHLLGIGRGADERGGLFEEMQVSIFEVSDLNDPLLAHRYSLGGGRTTASVATGDRWAEGDGDHHAVGYFPSEQILALPIFNAGFTAWRRASQIDNTPLFEPGEGGLQVLRLDVDAGIENVALIEHGTLISRSLEIGESLYVLSPETITVHAMSDPATELGRLDIAANDQAVYTPWVVAEYAALAQLNVAGITEIESFTASPETRFESTQAYAGANHGAGTRGFAPAPRREFDVRRDIASSRDAAFSLATESAENDETAIDLQHGGDLDAAWPTVADNAFAAD